MSPVFLCEPAQRDPVFRGFPLDLEVFEWHSDTFDLPPGAVRLARSPRYENQAFRVGSVAYAIQSHLETTLGEVRESWTRPATSQQCSRAISRHDPVGRRSHRGPPLEWLGLRTTLRLEPGPSLVNSGEQKNRTHGHPRAFMERHDRPDDHARSA